MMQRILLIALLIELCVYLTAGGAALRHGYSLLVIVPAVLVAIVLVRFAYTLPSYWVAGLLRLVDGKGRPWGESLRGLLREIDVRALCISFLQPLAPLFIGKEPRGPNSGLPVVLLHGYVMNRASMWRLRGRLSGAGVGPVFTLGVEPVFGSIDAMVPQLATKVAQVRDATGAEAVILVAHSMGGLVCRAWLANGGSAQVARLVTLGTPHHGTRMAVFAVGTCVRQMRRGSEWLAQLAERERARDLEQVAVPLISLYTENDDIVYPPESSRLDWATNVPFSGVGHVGLLFSDQVFERVLAEIQQANTDHACAIPELTERA